MKRTKFLVFLGFVLIAAAFTVASDACALTNRPVIVDSNSSFDWSPVLESHYTPRTPGAKVYGYRHGYLGRPDLGDVSNPQVFAQKATLGWWTDLISRETRTVPLAHWAFEEVQRRRPSITFNAYVYGHAKNTVDQIAKGQGVGFQEHTLQTGEYFWLLSAGGGPANYTQAREWYNAPGSPLVKCWALTSRAYGSTRDVLVLWGCGNGALEGLHLWVVFVPMQAQTPPALPPTSPASAPEEVADFQVAGASMPGTKTTYVAAPMPAPNIFIPLPSVPKPAPAGGGAIAHIGGATFGGKATGAQSASDAATLAQSLISAGVPAAQAEQIALAIAQKVDLSITGTLPGMDIVLFSGQAPQ